MTATNTEHQTPPTNSRWLFAGHSSANCAELAEVFNSDFPGMIRSCDLKDDESNFSEVLKEIAAVALIISAQSGVSKSMIEFWNFVSERQYPRMIMVTALELSESDFDDIVMIANRVLEQVTTPFLVLHDEIGEPSGLISLADLTVYDYSQKPMKHYAADSELKSLVSEFKSEFDSQMQGFEKDGFINGLEVPAIPVVIGKEIGVGQVKPYLELVVHSNF
ncbi:MAG: hypothetical protein FGM47_00540 [Candidatus Nanopelagicaceae bacterium]|nr:hypothetical protein [Candidatus Nanopelagicaceae bacterium]